MRVRQLQIENFRGVRRGVVQFVEHTLLVGGNNVGKSTVCEALDLVLGPERLYRRPVVDEHDFNAGNYLCDDGSPRAIRIDAILIELSEEALRRFGSHIRRWDDAVCEFIDEDSGGLDRADDEGVIWALPLVFLGQYDEDEDDFAGDTFFNHPIPIADELDDEQRVHIGEGRAQFTRAHKRLCGFVFLRTLRTGSRAMSLQRGSLLDTILRLGGGGSAQMWRDTLATLQELEPAIGDIAQLQSIRGEIRTRLGKFVNLAQGDDAVAFFASDLTREHLREVVRLFVATQPSEHLVPYSRQGTGSINLLVFALLTLIAELKGNRSVIFAMEEPEIALPPHTQRRVTRFVLRQMGQSIVTSHSPYVIEQFEPGSIVMLNRTGDELIGQPIDTVAVKPKTYRTSRRQFAEAILSQAVLVVEGSTEAVVFTAASSVLERLHPDTYTHFDLAGVSLFTATGDGDVPRFGPVFKALNKYAFGVWDKPSSPPAASAEEDRKAFDRYWESPETGIERLLVKQTPVPVLRRFLDDVSTRSDFPTSVSYSIGVPDDQLDQLAFKVLKMRKGEASAYAAVLIEHCHTEIELPKFICDVLTTIDQTLRPDADEIAISPPTIEEEVAPKQGS